MALLNALFSWEIFLQIGRINSKHGSYPCYTGVSKALEPHVIRLKCHHWTVTRHFSKASGWNAIQVQGGPPATFEVLKCPRNVNTFIHSRAVSSRHNYKHNYLRVNFHFKEQVLDEILHGKIKNQRAIETTKNSNEAPLWPDKKSMFLTGAELSKVISIKWTISSIFTTI